MRDCERLGEVGPFGVILGRVSSGALEGTISNYDQKLSAVGSMLDWVTVKDHQQHGLKSLRTFLARLSARQT